MAALGAVGGQGARSQVAAGRSGWGRGLGIGVLVVVLAVYGGAYLALPFSNFDPLIYVMIGRALWHGVLPYDAIFDHKPVLLYAIYGLADRGFGWAPGFFAVFAIASCAVIAWIAARLRSGDPGTAGRGAAVPWPGVFWSVFLFQLLAGARFAVLSGNAEAAFTPICAGVVMLLVRRTDARAMVWAGMLAMAAVQTNYLSGVALALPVLFGLWSDGRLRGYVLRALAFGFGAVLVLGALAALYVLDGRGIWSDYLAYQVPYLRHYGGGASARWEACRLFGLCLVAFVPFLWVVWRACGRERPVRLMLLWVMSGWLACCVSGHAYAHYFTLVLGPLAILFGLAWGWVGRARLWGSLLPVAVMSCVWLVHDTTHAWRMRADLAATDYAGLARVVGDVPVLSLDGSHVPYFMAHLHSVNRYVFPGHVRTIFGARAEGFLEAALDRGPAFVLTQQGGCPADWPHLCGDLAAHYRPVLRSVDRYDFGFVLYGRLPSAQPGAPVMH
ncbi:hypothetical protein [Tanticharoenia sakaeratensis]|uniref:Glycosyltransferase RgtA/B/C/D-like domain-containing protein n=1 Tax=Tanticharoenia sakaeratensis NBRC 103193 TaxID=1231623 RepID=A0A0D6MPI7_9PROT|nr:hypothetical protein [Tanticharoenia sakaeratensis]GAN55285.1 hypothetical protein Tasa_042_003 [Tanticharoenia sakaeratensis NBRC 103193]GBQ25567.1 hypothetical protein AA103193_3127 [Tanticharoenia sakaeratensis NBRC 103193]